MKRASTNKIVIVFDLGPGDGGKGGVVHKLCDHHKAHTVIKQGGAQGSHGVCVGDKKFAFSQWGCGTFEGVKTHIPKTFVTSPEGLLNEADALLKVGVPRPFGLLTVDGGAICATPYHGIASRIIELQRKNNPRGTIGTGVGQAFRYHQSNPVNTIYVRDLIHSTHSKLKDTRDLIRYRLKGFESPEQYLEDDLGLVEEQFALLNDDGFLHYNTQRFQEVGSKLNVVDSDHLRNYTFKQDGVAIVESSHGILTDSHHGFHPHVSAIRTVPSLTAEMLRLAGHAGVIETIGVHRAYTIRHGAGPMPTADPAMNEKLLPGSHKEENRWQGKIRTGPLDFVLLRYAVEVVKRDCHIDGLAISWFDQVAKNESWDYCDGYRRGVNLNYFHGSNQLKAYDLLSNSIRQQYGKELTEVLNKCEPIVESVALPDSMDEQFNLCDRMMREKLGVPVHMVSFGPSGDNKLVRELTNV